MEHNELQGIVSLFDFQGTVSGIAPLGEGLINDTYRVTTTGGDTDRKSVV